MELVVPLPPCLTRSLDGHPRLQMKDIIGPGRFVVVGFDGWYLVPLMLQEVLVGVVRCACQVVTLCFCEHISS